MGQKKSKIQNFIVKNLCEKNNASIDIVYKIFMKIHISKINENDNIYDIYDILDSDEYRFAFDIDPTLILWDTITYLDIVITDIARYSYINSLNSRHFTVNENKWRRVLEPLNRDSDINFKILYLDLLDKSNKNISDIFKPYYLVEIIYNFMKTLSLHEKTMAFDADIFIRMNMDANISDNMGILKQLFPDIVTNEYKNYCKNIKMYDEWMYHANDYLNIIKKIPYNCSDIEKYEYQDIYYVVFDIVKDSFNIKDYEEWKYLSLKLHTIYNSYNSIFRKKSLFREKFNSYIFPYKENTSLNCISKLDGVIIDLGKIYEQMCD